MNYEEIWETYVLSWKIENSDDKKTLFSKCLTADCVYHDPITKTQGWEELSAYMQEFHKQIAGGYFATTEFFSHGHKSVAKWEMRDGNDIVLGNGISYGEYNHDGRLYEMTGFFQIPQS